MVGVCYSNGLAWSWKDREVGKNWWFRSFQTTITSTFYSVRRWNWTVLANLNLSNFWIFPNLISNYTYAACPLMPPNPCQCLSSGPMFLVQSSTQDIRYIIYGICLWTPENTVKLYWPIIPITNHVMFKTRTNLWIKDFKFQSLIKFKNFSFG